MTSAFIACIAFVLWLLSWYQSRRPLGFEPNQTYTLKTTLEVWAHDKLISWCLLILFAYCATLSALQFLWYGKDGMVPFHWFDDLDEWQQMDKIGHYLSTFHIARVIILTFWSNGIAKTKGAIVGGISGWLCISLYEWFDGHSPAYGASYYDIAANGLGALSAALQLWLYGQARILPQVSFHASPWAALRPNVLGQGASETWLKDYNGQTLWFLVNPHYLLGWKKWPHWLGISLGYGAEAMVYGRLFQNEAHGYHPYRQWYISLSPDLTFLKTNSNTYIRRLSYFADIFHIPTPCLELNYVSQLVYTVSVLWTS